jgi:type IV secretion system protein VirB9
MSLSNMKLQVNTSIQKISTCIVLLSSLFVQPSVLAQGQVMRTFAYKPNSIYTVNAGLGVATQIVLDPAEKIKDFGTGFSSGWDIVRRDHIFYIKPKAPDAETNMYIRTDKRSYIFDLKIVTKDWKRLEEAKQAGVVYLIEFNYPDKVEGASLTLTPGFNKDGSPILPTVPANDQYMSFNMDYDYSAVDSAKFLVPVRVYDDGQVTFVQMAESAKSPVFFGKDNEKGEEFLVNFTASGAATKNVYKLHGVYPYIIIRSANSVVGVRRR